MNSSICVKVNPNDYQGSGGTGSFATMPWMDFNFVITKPFYYYYSYSTELYTDGASAVNSMFAATASASLSDVCIVSIKLWGINR